MKIWIVLVALGLLLLLVFGREHFEATQSIKAPPYGDAEKVRMYDMVRQRSAKPPYTFLGHQTTLMDKAKALTPDEKNETKLKATAGGLISPAVESFYTTVYKPATIPVTEADIDKFLATRSSDITAIEKDILTTYFVGQSGVGTSGGGYADLLKGLGQEAGTLRANRTAGPGGVDWGAAGATGATGVTGATGSPPPSTTVTGDPALMAALLAKRSNTATPEQIALINAADPEALRSASAMADMVAPASTPATGPSAGGTTGGSSDSSPAPNAGGGGRGRNVFGPEYTSLGSPVGNGDGDSSKGKKYPELLGGIGDQTSVRGPGGIRNPSQNWLLSQSGALPSTASLGTDANSGYLPYSRTPGDQDLIPDPYRLSRNYSTASYSSKTDPVPFLTDFSAFLK